MILTIPQLCITQCRWCRSGSAALAKPETRVTPRAYTEHMDAWKNPIEDERGVDISQIHRQLQMSVEERVLHMVEAANTFMEIRSHARFVDVP